ncbi:hypothetical protein SE17_16705 [Kouleothrix aurantiaca]|uniref:N-acetyltransferase domain-containing protein n=1 Tax=Kouleothrix aurantiaca TaxID=186479 RepID=A0A0P9DQ05_9CHLR|nr:hypothetical protein SE17_16705 [Kouleothrix aurantiaca]
MRLRDRLESDLPILFANQSDPLGFEMAGFSARDWDTFLAHHARISANPSNIIKTILAGEQVAGDIGSWEMDGERDVGYWIGREFWGRGIATRALAAFLEELPERPLYAHVVKHNQGSRRVLEKCGFALCGENDEELILKLE